MLMLQKMHALNVRRPSVSSYYANASQFDGTNDYLAKASAISAATSSGVTLAMWINPSTLPSTAGYLFDLSGTDYQIAIVHAADGSLAFASVDLVNGRAYQITSAPGAISTGTWKLLMASASLNFSAGNKLGHFYLGDTSIASSISDPDAAFTPNFSNMTSASIGRDNGGAFDRYNGGMAEVYVSTVYTDLSVEANRRKFITAGGKPESLGTDGSLVSGSIPAVYLNNPFGTFHTNKGSGGNFTVTGALTAAATSPSD